MGYRNNEVLGDAADSGSGGLGGRGRDIGNGARDSGNFNTEVRTVGAAELVVSFCGASGFGENMAGVGGCRIQVPLPQPDGGGGKWLAGVIKDGAGDEQDGSGGGGGGC